MGTIPSGSVIWGRANLGSRKNILYEFYRNYFCWIRNLWDGQFWAAIIIFHRNFILISPTGTVSCGLGTPVPSCEFEIHVFAFHLEFCADGRIQINTREEETRFDLRKLNSP